MLQSPDPSVHVRHFLKETDFSRAEAARLFDLARRFKRERGQEEQVLAGQTWGMLFSKSSTRTRVSFEVGIQELGGRVVYLEQRSMQLGRGETIADTARVLSRYLHGLVIRTHEHAIAEDFAREGSVPVVNALTDSLHPCQIYSDLFSLAEVWDGQAEDMTPCLRGRKLCYLGDCANNLA